ncbi:Bug family tripartite tricarboxylate transporter substrate binding protein [Achromobacter sp. ESBL13]|uniref:Bug family tripartite tricarboxylate transporter substrate binding protein n=1 Tax=Achromobacter sp. ESBL13 TaxID=3077328 RepID=UPI002FC80548
MDGSFRRRAGVLAPLPRFRGALGLMCAVTLGLAFGTASWAAGAQAAYPERPIRLIVPFAAGSAADTLSRVVASALSDQLGQPLVVDNKGGAGGTIGTVDIARAKPDGYTLGIAAQGTFVNNQVLYKSPGYDSIKDFTFVSEIADVQNLLVVDTKSPYQDAPSLLAAIKAKPAESFRYSSSGVGTSHHIAGATVAQMLNKPLLHVPYTGAPQGLGAIISGDVDMGLYNLPAAIGLVRGGKLRALAVTGPKRSTLLPDVPTMQESGLANYSVTLWWGLVGPAGLPADVSTRLHAALDKVMSQAALRDKLIGQGFTLPDTPLPKPAAFEALVRQDLAKWVPVLKELGTAAQ